MCLTYSRNGAPITSIKALLCGKMYLEASVRRCFQGDQMNSKGRRNAENFGLFGERSFSSLKSSWKRLKRTKARPLWKRYATIKDSNRNVNYGKEERGEFLVSRGNAPSQC
jgi:hypothetical protein